jgi:hypothetical protein
MSAANNNEPQDDVNYWIVRGMINLAALGLFAGLIALIVATIVVGAD